jgi:hypothetical protein
MTHDMRCALWQVLTMVRWQSVRGFALILGLNMAATCPAQMPRAGEVSASVTHAAVERANSKIDAAKGTQIDWNDVLSTDKVGRARVVLDDQSILTLGSRSRRTVIKHDSASQQTELELKFGRIRCQVKPLTGAGSSFRLRTPDAVVGVIGTDFGADSSVPG